MYLFTDCNIVISAYTSCWQLMVMQSDISAYTSCWQLMVMQSDISAYTSCWQFMVMQSDISAHTSCWQFTVMQSDISPLTTWTKSSNIRNQEIPNDCDQLSWPSLTTLCIDFSRSRTAFAWPVCVISVCGGTHWSNSSLYTNAAPHMLFMWPCVAMAIASVVSLQFERRLRLNRQHL